MATGANDAYWVDAKLPGVIKHGILRRYAAIFLSRTSARTGVAVHLDGYAGRGYHDNGSPGSAGIILEFAREQLLTHQRKYVVRLFEKDPTNYNYLEQAVRQFRDSGVDVQARKADVLTGIDDLLAVADGHSLFMFLDPCGIGLPLDVIVGALNRSRNRAWPPTEVLLNFSLEAVRRIGGAYAKGAASESALSKLDEALGGTWWREYYTHGYDEGSAERILGDYCRRLGDATDMSISAVPVRRAPGHKPIYYLVFATRNARGYWNFSDAVARSVEEWWKQSNAAEEDAGHGQLALIARAPRLDDIKEDAVAQIEQNILQVLETVPRFTVGDRPISVLGDYYGAVPDTFVRQAIKNLHRKGKTPSNGVGKKIEDLVVARPTQ